MRSSQTFVMVGSNTLKYRYRYERDKGTSLFLRAHKFIFDARNQNTEGEEAQGEEKASGFDRRDFENELFEEDLKLRDQRSLVKYLTFKFVLTNERDHKLRILEMTVDWVKDEFNNLWLSNCMDLKIDESKLSHSHKFKKINIIDSEARQSLLEYLDSFNKQLKLARKVNIKEIADYLQEKYEGIKDKYGIDLEAKTPENSFSDNVFKELNPRSEFRLSELIQKNSSKRMVVNIEDKANLLNNFPKERRDFLMLVKEEQNIGNKLTSLEKKKIDHDFLMKKILAKPVAERSSSQPASAEFSLSKTKFSRDFENNYKKKMKILEHCNNGFSKKKHVNPVEYKNYFEDLSKKIQLTTFKRERPSTVTFSGSWRFSGRKFEKPKEGTVEQLNRVKGMRLTLHTLNIITDTLPFLLQSKQNV